MYTQRISRSRPVNTRSHRKKADFSQHVCFLLDAHNTKVACRLHKDNVISRRLEAQSISRITKMTNRLWMLSVKIQNLLSREEGQDLVEYALIVALISLAAITGMNNIVEKIKN